MREKHYCSNENCDTLLTGDHEEFHEAVAGGHALCDDCLLEYEKEKEAHKPASYKSDSLETIKRIMEKRKAIKLERRERFSVGSFNYDEIFSDIFGGA